MNLKAGISGASWAPRNGENKFWVIHSAFLSEGPGSAKDEPQDRPSEMSKMNQKPLNEYFWTMQGSIRLGKCLQIVSDARKSIFLGHAWLEKCPKLVSDAVFEKRANENTEKAGTEPYPPRSEKRVKTRGFRNIFEKHKEERVVVWMEPKRKKRVKTRCFRLVFEARMSRESFQKSFGPARWLGIRQI